MPRTLFFFAYWLILFVCAIPEVKMEYPMREPASNQIGGGNLARNMMLSTTKRVDNVGNSYTHLPTLSIIIRTYHIHIPVYMNYFFNGWNLFWPEEYFQSEHVLVMDSESAKDLKAAATLNISIKAYYQNLAFEADFFSHRMPRIIFEEHPGPNILKPLDNWPEGYSRQLRSTFYLDKQSIAEYVARADGGNSFISPVTPSLLFDKHLRPRLYGYNMPYAQRLCPPIVEKAIGANCIADFMIISGFPVIWKRSHLRQMRDFVTRSLGKKSFDEAFGYMLRNLSGYLFSPESMITMWLYYYKHDEYDWHIRDGRGNNNRENEGVQVTDEISDLTVKYNVPIISRMKQIVGHDKTQGLRHLRFHWQLMVCVASRFVASGCENLNRVPTQKILNRWMDYQLSTEYYCAPLPNTCSHHEHMWNTKAEPNFRQGAAKVYKDDIEKIVWESKSRGIYAFGYLRGALFYNLEGVNKDKVKDIDFYNSYYLLDDGLIIQINNVLLIVVNDTLHSFGSIGDFAECGYDISESVKVKGDILEVQSVGEAVDPKNFAYHKSSFSAIFPEGSVIKSIYSKKLYIVVNASAHDIPSFDALTEAGFDGSEIRIVPKPQIDALPLGGRIRSKEGMYNKHTFDLYK